jgi:hypothetical protein
VLSRKKTVMQWLEFPHQQEGLGFYTFHKLSFSSTDKRDGKEKRKEHPSNFFKLVL